MISPRVLDESVNQQWRVARIPDDIPTAADFAWHEEAVPEPGPGQALLRTLYLGLAPVMRAYMRGTGAAGEAVLGVGDLIHGRGVAQVVKSRHPDWPEGEVVQGQIGWQTWKVTGFSPQEKFFRVRRTGLPARHSCKTLGMTGLSAHAGLFAVGEPRPGDRMVLSGAAGGVGSIVAQLASGVAGCDVVGIAGGPEKTARLRTLGCSAVIDYKAGEPGPALDQLRPDGIDLYFDNVGGATLAAVLERLRPRARIVLCGSISEYVPGPWPLTNYTRLRATDSQMRGFFVYNHLDRWDAVMDEMAGWIIDGRLVPVEDVVDGFEQMPAALARLYRGGNFGAQMVSVRGEPEEWR